MEKLTTIQEARLRCLQMANDWYVEENKKMKSGDGYSYDAIVFRAEKYLNYILEGVKPEQRSA